MHPTRRELLAIGAGAATTALLPRMALAQQYPDRPIKLVVPYTPGGPASLLSRFIGEKLGQTLGQPVVIENKPGAGLSVGAQSVATSPADGYTLLVGASSMLVPAGGGRTPEQNLKEFAPVSLIGGFPLVMVVSPKIEARTVQELIAYIRSKPGQVNYGTSGHGSLTHLAAALFAQQAGVNMLHVPYRGINEALLDVAADRVQLSFAGAPIALQSANTGKVRAMAVTSLERTSSAPQLPTFAESGLAGYEVNPWYGVLAPAGTPPAVLQRLHSAVTTIMQSEEVKERWKTWGADPLFSRSPADFTSLMQKEAAKWSNLIKQAGLKLE